jgi:hypothetical protein
MSIKWAIEHPEEYRAVHKASNAKWYLKNREKSNKDTRMYNVLHPELAKRYRAKNYRANLDMYRASSTENNLQLKTKVLTHYGNGVCACVTCGFSDIDVLSIDHIEGGGNAHRKSLPNGQGTHFYYWLVKNDLPLGYQTLCMNCNWKKRKKSHECGKKLL